MAFVLVPVFVLYVIVFLGGVYLFCGAFSRRGRQAPRWVRLAFCTVGTLTVGWSLLGYVEHSWHAQFSPSVIQRLFQGKTLCAGGCLSIFFLLFASGEFLRAFSRRRLVA